MNPANFTSAVGAILAVAVSVFTLWRQHVAERNAYLMLTLKLKSANEGRLLIAQTSVENRSKYRKRVDAVRLFVCPASEEPVAAANTLLNRQPALHSLRKVATVPISGPLSDGERLLVPLPYYTKENIRVSDEILTYDAVIDVSTFRAGVAYSVRLMLVESHRPERTVHKAFVR